MTKKLLSELNQAMDDLLSGPEIPSDYGSVMVEWYRDTSRGVIVRDFAVQHIGLYAQALNRNRMFSTDSFDAENCRRAFQTALIPFRLMKMTLFTEYASDLVAGYSSGDFARKVAFERNRDLVLAVTNSFGSIIISFHYHPIACKNPPPSTQEVQ